MAKDGSWTDSEGHQIPRDDDAKRQREMVDLVDDGELHGPELPEGAARRGNTEEFHWVTSHILRKTAATMTDEAGMTARDIANHMGHSKVSLTQDFYMGREVTDRRAAEVLDAGISGE